MSSFRAVTILFLYDMKKLKIKKAIKPKPEKGYKFLQSIPTGEKFVTQSGYKGMVISQNIGSVLCKFTSKTPNSFGEEDIYYLGTRRIAPETNVKHIKEKT